jgi:hypothetical protein
MLPIALSRWRTKLARAVERSSVCSATTTSSLGSKHRKWSSHPPLKQTHFRLQHCESTVQISETFVSLPRGLLNFLNLKHAPNMLDDLALLVFKNVTDHSRDIVEG